MKAPTSAPAAEFPANPSFTPFHEPGTPGPVPPGTNPATAPNASSAPAAPGAEWWRDAVVYEVFPRSFLDGDGDGDGDLLGLRARLDYLSELGVDAIWLAPFYPSPWVDAGYDVTDYRAVAPRMGTLADFDAVLFRAHELGMKLIIDVSPSHVSDQHPWFEAAVQAGPGSPERERFIFRDGTGEGGVKPPNEWTSHFGGSAWNRVQEPDGRPGQWYLHQFDVHEPDVNWSNPDVRAQFEAALRFWLERGVDGFRVNLAHTLLGTSALPRLAPEWGVAPTTEWDTLARLHQPAALPGAAGREAHDAGNTGPAGTSPAAADAFEFQPGDPADGDWHMTPLHNLFREWRQILDSYPGDRVLLGEAWVAPAGRLAHFVRPGEMNHVFNAEFLTAPHEAEPLRRVIGGVMEAMDRVGAPTTWMLSNHDVIRHSTRLSVEAPHGISGGLGSGQGPADPAAALRRARAATLLMLALPGAAYLYQGEELGLPEDIDLPDDARDDPTWRRSGYRVRGRDGARVPLPWHKHAPSFGFSLGGQAWLPQPPAWGDLAADRQIGKAGSTYEMYRSALWLRRRQALGTGSLEWADLPEPLASRVVAFRNRDTLVLANLGPGAVRLPVQLPVLLSSSDLGAVHGGGALIEPDVTVWAALA